MVTLQREKLLGRGMLVSGLVRVSGGKYEINCYDEGQTKVAFKFLVRESGFVAGAGW